MKRTRGVSLVEAVVALAVMAFGMVGIVALQASMRQNADIAKQRSEAVRIAQDAIEKARAFTALSTTAGRAAYSEINDASDTVTGVNADYTRTITATNHGSGRTKTLKVQVAWNDRAGNAQAVQLETAVTGSVPELASTIFLPPFAAEGSWFRLPRARHGSIPPGAVDEGDGTSTFSPPGAGTLRWRFSNSTGLITHVCDSLTLSCIPMTARLLAGLVNFATGLAQPTAAEAENPPGPAFPVEVEVVTTAPTSSVVSCFEQTGSVVVAYFCAVPADALASWSGRSRIVGLPLVGAIADAAPAASFKVCRYTPVRGSHPTVGSGITNEEHPLDYAGVTKSLTNQHFLVIRAGDGSTPFECPADDSATPLINSNTWHHQPSA